MPTEVKICGLADAESVDAALAAGADYLGFVLFPPSPRHVGIAEAAALMRRARGRAATVALVVDPDDRLLEEAAALSPDYLQFHGGETPDRLAAFRAATGISVIKALGIASAADLALADSYAGCADRLILDAKPPRGATRPGGHGSVFDWSVLEAFRPGLPWLLSGGLSAANVAAALRVSGAGGVDVSSGVERAPGRKDPALIQAFVTAVRAADGSARRAAQGGRR